MRLHAQSAGVTVRGSDGAPLIRATVRFTCLDGACTDSTAARLTASDGRAANPFTARAAIAVSYVGYEPLHDTLRRGESRDVTLRPSVAPAVVVTAQYTPRSSELSVYDVRVFDRRRIEAAAAPTLRELMESALNVRLSEDHVLGTGVSIQGMSGQNVKILVDGVPVEGRLNGNIDLSQVSLANAERVEMIQGPLSAMYGTDALGGVINVITDRRARRGAAVAVNGYAESVGSVNVDGTLRLRDGGTSGMLSGARSFFGGYSRVDTSRAKQWKPREQYRGGWEIAQALDLLTLRYSGEYFQEYILNRGEPRLPYRETAFDDTYRTWRVTNTLALSGSPTAETYLDALASYSTYRRRKNTFFRDLVTLDQQITSDPADQDTTWLDAWKIRGSISSADTSAAIAWQGGVDLGSEMTGGRRIVDGRKEIGDYAAFGSIEYRPARWLVLQPALRAAYNTRYPAPLVPSLNLKIDPAEGMSLRLSYARGFRSPSLQELYFLFVDINHDIHGNEDLRAEQSHSVNALLRWRVPGVEGMEIAPSFFFSGITDLITLAQVGGDLYSYINVGRYGALGGGIDLSLHRAGFDLKLGASRIGRYDQLSELYPVGAYTFSNEISAELGLQVPLVDARLSAFYKYTGRLPSYQLDAGGALRESFVGDYQMLDLSLMRELVGRKLRVTLGLKNLFDVDDISVSGPASTGVHGSSDQVPVSWGRTAFISTALSLGGDR
jgi:outer membrane receptor for ferrienterochelin and colicins